MFTIIGITFRKPKVYEYLLDSRSVVKPKIGDKLKILREISSYGEVYETVNVVSLRPEKYLPEHVISVIRVMDEEMHVDDHRMKKTVLERLREPKKEVAKVVKKTRKRKSKLPVLPKIQIDWDEPLTKEDLAYIFCHVRRK